MRTFLTATVDLDFGSTGSDPGDNCYSDVKLRKP